MRLQLTAAVLGLAVIAGPVAGQGQGAGRLNPMISLHQQGLPVFGIGHPGITAGGGRGAAEGQAPPPQPVLADVARQTMEFKLGDFIFTSGASERFIEYLHALHHAGASAASYPFIAKVGIYHRNTDQVRQRIQAQLDAGHVGIMLEQVESAAEVSQGIAAARFSSQGGTRPDGNVGLAASYWGLTEAQYREKADVWPLNQNGELIVWAIIESVEGVEKAREIAATPGLGVLWAGWGTLNGVYNQDQEARQAAADKILAACKEFNVPCGFPASNSAEIERRIAEGWDVFVMQSFNDAGRDAVVAGRRLSSRSMDGGR